MIENGSAPPSTSPTRRKTLPIGATHDGREPLCPHVPLLFAKACFMCATNSSGDMPSGTVIATAPCCATKPGTLEKSVPAGSCVTPGGSPPEAAPGKAGADAAAKYSSFEEEQPMSAGDKVVDRRQGGMQWRRSAWCEGEREAGSRPTRIQLFFRKIKVCTPPPAQYTPTVLYRARRSAPCALRPPFPFPLSLPPALLLL